MSSKRLELAFIPLRVTGSITVRTPTPNDASVAHHGRLVAECRASIVDMVDPKMGPTVLSISVASLGVEVVEKEWERGDLSHRAVRGCDKQGMDAFWSL